jgi:hypothetical protein
MRPVSPLASNLADTPFRIWRVSIHTLDRFPTDVRAFLERVASKAADKPTQQYSVIEPTQELLERWAIPLVRWEERSYFPVEQTVLLSTLSSALDPGLAAVDRAVA